MSANQAEAGGAVKPTDFWYPLGGSSSRSSWYRVRELYACGESGRIGEPGIGVSSMWTGARKADMFTEKNIVASDVFGGLVAVVRNDKTLQEVDSTSRAIIRIYTAAGSLLSCVPLPTKDVIALQWVDHSSTAERGSSSILLAVVASDLTVVLLSPTTTTGEVVHRYTLPQDKLLREEGGVEIIRTWSDGMVLVSAAGRVHACIGWKNGMNLILLGSLPPRTRPVCLLPLEGPSKSTNDVRCLISVEEEEGESSSNTAGAVGVGASRGRVLVLDKNGRQEEILTGALTIPESGSGAKQEFNDDFRRPLGVVISMAKSFSGHMVALLSDCGRFRILPTSPDLNPEYHQPPVPPPSAEAIPIVPAAGSGSLVVTPADVATAQRRVPPTTTSVTAPQNSDPFCPPVPSSVADAASPMSTCTRVSLQWCGDDAVAVYVTDSRRGSHSLYLGGTAPAFTTDPAEYWVDPPFNFDNGIYILTEADALRILDLNQSLLIQRVSPATEAVFGFGGTKSSPPATLAYAYERYAKRGDVRSELSVRSLRGGSNSSAELQRAVMGCIEAATAETPAITREAQQRVEGLMKAAQFGRRFLQATPTAGGMPAISKAVVIAAAYIRVTTALAQAPVYMPATVTQAKLLSPSGVVARVAARPGQQLLAFRIAEWLGCDPSSAVENWVDALLASPDSARMTDREILSAIMDKMKFLPQQCLAASVGASSTDPLRSSSTTLAAMARICVRYNRQAVASQLLLSLDGRSQQQPEGAAEATTGGVTAGGEQVVGLLLSLGSVSMALRKAVDAGSPDSIQRCISAVIDSAADVEDAANDLIRVCKEGDLTSAGRVLVASLVLNRWRQDGGGSRIIGEDVGVKMVLRALHGASAVAQHSAMVALRTAITAPVAQVGKEETSSSGDRWWSRLGRSDSAESRVLTRSDAADMFRNAGGEFSGVYGTTREPSAQMSAVVLQEESDLCRSQAQLERLSAMRGWTRGGENKFVGTSLWQTVRRLVVIGELEEARKLLTKLKVLPEYERRWWKVAVDALVEAGRFSELAQMAGSSASGGPPIGFEPIVALLLENQQFDLAKGLIGRCKDMEQVASFYETLGMREEAMKAQQLAEQQRRSIGGSGSILTGWSSTIAGAVMRGGFTRS